MLEKRYTLLSVALTLALAAFSMQSHAQTTNARWDIASVGLKAQSPYCSMKRKYDDGQTIVFGRDTREKNTLAIDFGIKILRAGQQYPIHLAVSNTLTRRASAVAATPSVLLVNMGYDDAFYDALARQNVLHVSTGQYTSSYSLSGTSDALLELQSCAENLPGHVAYVPPVQSVVAMHGRRGDITVDLLEEIADLETENSNLRKKALMTDKANEEKAALTKKLQEQARQNEEEKQAIIAELEEKAQSAGRMSLSRVSKLEKRLKQLQVEKNTLDAALQQADIFFDNMRQDAARNETRKQELQVQLAKARTDLQQARAVASEERRKAAQVQVAAQAAALEPAAGTWLDTDAFKQLETEKNALDAALQQADKIFDAMKQDIAQSELSRKQLQEELVKTRTELRQARTDMQQQQRKMSEFQARVSSANASEANTALIRQLQNEKDTLDAALRRADTVVEAMKRDMAETQAGKRQLQEQLAQTRAALQKTRTDAEQQKYAAAQARQLAAIEPTAGGRAPLNTVAQKNPDRAEIAHIDLSQDDVLRTWRTASGFYGEARAVPMRQGATMQAMVNSYFHQMESLCSGGFSHQRSGLTQHQDVVVQKAEMRCTGGEQESIAALLFVIGDGSLAIITHEGPVALAQEVQSERDRFFEESYKL